MKNVFKFAPMDEKKRELIGAATMVYMQYGIKSVTMDEMARQLGISKKTLYQYVKDKNDLVEQCVQAGQAEDIRCIDELIDQYDNAIEQVYHLSNFVTDELKRVHPSIFFDLAKYHPKAMKLMEKHKHEYVTGCMRDNLKLGIEQGLYRENLNAEIISRTYVRMIDAILGANRTIGNAGFKPDEIYSEYFRYHIRGIASAKGLEYLQTLIKKNENL